MRVLIVLSFLSIPSGLFAQDRSSDERRLLHLHAEVIRAHVERQVDLWMSLESENYISVNRGEVTFPGFSERREQRSAYLQGASFSTYRDLREPIVRISEDGSLGWLIAEVEIVGTVPDQDNGRSSFHDIWAWIELYEKTDQDWRLIGNVSNRR
jgi:hypothetical protein